VSRYSVWRRLHNEVRPEVSGLTRDGFPDE
jgi:hypothetical protein